MYKVLGLSNGFIAIQLWFVNVSSNLEYAKLLLGWLVSNPTSQIEDVKLRLRTAVENLYSSTSI